MYVAVRPRGVYSPLGALPRWLTPPQALRNLVGGIFGAVVKGTTVTVPTPAGPQVFNLGDPEDRKRLEALARGVKLNVATPQAGSTGFPALVESVPGGWGTIAVVGLVGALLIGRSLKR